VGSGRIGGLFWCAALIKKCLLQPDFDVISQIFRVGGSWRNTHQPYPGSIPMWGLGFYEPALPPIDCKIIQSFIHSGIYAYGRMSQRPESRNEQLSIPGCLSQPYSDRDVTIISLGTLWGIRKVCRVVRATLSSYAPAGFEDWIKMLYLTALHWRHCFTAEDFSKTLRCFES
jgi:hypothetical protein